MVSLLSGHIVVTWLTATTDTSAAWRKQLTLGLEHVRSVRHSNIRTLAACADLFSRKSLLIIPNFLMDFASVCRHMSSPVAWKLKCDFDFPMLLTLVVASEARGRWPQQIGSGHRPRGVGCAQGSQEPALP